MAKVTSEKTTPKVGMGVTQCIGSDRYPFTVIEVSENLKTVVIQLDTYSRTDSNGLSESQEYEFSRNSDGEKITLTLRKNGCYVQKGQPMRGSGYFYRIGTRSAYRDPSF